MFVSSSLLIKFLFYKHFFFNFIVVWIILFVYFLYIFLLIILLQYYSLFFNFKYLRTICVACFAFCSKLKTERALSNEYFFSVYFTFFFCFCWQIQRYEWNEAHVDFGFICQWVSVVGIFVVVVAGVVYWIYNKQLIFVW